MTLLLRVQRFAARHSLWRSDTRVIAAVSGGSDSVALLHILWDLHERDQIVLAGVAHLNHGIRGEEADADEAFCRAMAARFELPLFADRVDVPALSRLHHQSLEVAARNARRAFLDEVRLSRAADVVATAHTRDDQAETVLLRLVRGTGMRGMAGIAPIRDGRIRPLLECSREELRDHLRAGGILWREDSSNDDLAIPRNRVRHELLPYLERHFSPAVRVTLARAADLARADEAALERETLAAVPVVAEVGSGGARIDVAGLNRLPEAIARRVVRNVLERLGATPAADDVRTIRDIAAGMVPAAEIAGWRVEHSSGSVVLVPSGSLPPATRRFRLELPIPGSVQLPAAGWILEAEGPIRRTHGYSGLNSPDEVEIDAAGVGHVLVVRSREPGDRMRPLGLGGQKKVQDVFVDRKVSRIERDLVPIVTDEFDRIVWVAGHSLGEEFRVTKGTNAVVILKLRRG